MRYLFLLTITPVQDFISQARKLKDLFGGSSILSEMAKIGIKYSEECGGEVIFPQKATSGNSNSYPNRFLIEINFDSENELKEFAYYVTQKILDNFKNLNKTDNKIVEKHLEEFFQIYWSASEYKDNYKEAFDEVEKKLAGAKNSRFFTQLGEVGRKCSLCGERNIAVYKKHIKFYIDKQRKNLWELKDDRLQNGEGLCGVCYVKRVGSKTKFNSTADISIMNIPLEIREKYKLLSKDSQLFYEENLTNYYFKKNSLNDLEKYQDEYRKFKEETKNCKQTSYYAVVMFDGDDMGQWLSGKNITDEKKLKDFHKNISENLANFAIKAKEILKEPRGMTIYAGGEDFLGFVNINNLFEVIDELNKNFKSMISDKIEDKKERENFTFSAGIVIAHYKTPLSEVLKEARISEKKAKKNSGKDSICLTVLKHSGERREAIFKNNKLENIKNITQELKNSFSDKFISTLEREFLIMVEDNKLDIKKSIIVSELTRLLKRSKKIENPDIDKMRDLISNIYTKDFKNFTDTLAVSKFISRKI